MQSGLTLSIIVTSLNFSDSFKATARPMPLAPPTTSA